MADQLASQQQHTNLDDLEAIFQVGVALDDRPALVCHCDADGENNAVVAAAGCTSPLLAVNPNSCLQTILPRFGSHQGVEMIHGVSLAEKEALTVLNHYGCSMC